MLLVFRRWGSLGGLLCWNTRPTDGNLSFNPKNPGRADMIVQVSVLPALLWGESLYVHGPDNLHVQ